MDVEVVRGATWGVDGWVDCAAGKSREDDGWGMGRGLVAVEDGGGPAGGARGLAMGGGVGCCGGWRRRPAGCLDPPAEQGVSPEPASGAVAGAKVGAGDGDGGEGDASCGVCRAGSVRDGPRILLHRRKVGGSGRAVEVAGDLPPGKESTLKMRIQGRQSGVRAVPLLRASAVALTAAGGREAQGCTGCGVH